MTRTNHDASAGRVCRILDHDERDQHAHHPAHIVIYEISEERLDYFASGTRAPHASWAGACLGVVVLTAVSLASTWRMGTLVVMLMAGLLIAAVGMVTYFSQQAVREFWAHGRRLWAFKNRTA